MHSSGMRMEGEHKAREQSHSRMKYICIANKLKLCSISKGPASQPLLCRATSAIYSFIIRSFIDLTWSLDRFNFTLPNRSIFSFLIITLFYWTIFIIFHFHLWTEGVVLCCALFSKVVFALLYLLNIEPSAIVLCLCLYLLFYCVRVCVFFSFFLTHGFECLPV